VRIAFGVLRAQADEFQHFVRRSRPFGERAEALQAHRLGNVDSGRHARIERG
jgi:hypothetical protein